MEVSTRTELGKKARTRSPARNSNVGAGRRGERERGEEARYGRRRGPARGAAPVRPRSPGAARPRGRSGFAIDFSILAFYVAGGAFQRALLTARRRACWSRPWQGVSDGAARRVAISSWGNVAALFCVLSLAIGANSKLLGRPGAPTLLLQNSKRTKEISQNKPARQTKNDRYTFLSLAVPCTRASNDISSLSHTSAEAFQYPHYFI